MSEEAPENKVDRLGQQQRDMEESRACTIGE